MKIHLTATEAADFLNISKTTLYAYVSRGLVRSEYGLNQRSRVYHRLDLERLKQRNGSDNNRRQKWRTPCTGAVPFGIRPHVTHQWTSVLSGKRSDRVSLIPNLPGSRNLVLDRQLGSLREQSFDGRTERMQPRSNSAFS